MHRRSFILPTLALALLASTLCGQDAAAADRNATGKTPLVVFAHCLCLPGRAL